MDPFFNWLSKNPIVTITLIAAFSLLVVAVIVIYLIAFLQGRIISFWPPSIGKKPERLMNNEKSTESPPKEDIDSTKKNPGFQDAISLNWPLVPVTSELILKNAHNSLLLSGTSLFRVMHGDLFKYHDWLNGDPSRTLGVLFLNPYSPHAFHRERDNAKRSSVHNILQSLRTACTETKKNPQFITAVYDGPYRYSARATDIGPGLESNHSLIDIITSSSHHGTSKGFHITLAGVRNSDCYKFYKQELLELWKNALANNPGHGISLISRNKFPFEWEFLQDLRQALLSEFDCNNYDLHLFSPEQHHLTISSICRTENTPFAPPLSIGVDSGEEKLPSHFPDFLYDVANSAIRISEAELKYKFDRLDLDQFGQIRLATSDQVNTDNNDQINKFFKYISELVIKYSEKYPKESWITLLEEKDGNRFGPKYKRFMPHVTIGMAFNHNSTLPTILKGETLTMALKEPIRFVNENFSIIHYAYRSLLRNVGEIKLNGKLSIASPDVILHKLGITKDI